MGLGIQWGYQNALLELIFSWYNLFNIVAINGLGLVTDEDALAPIRVEGLKGQAKPEGISAGYGFTLVHDENNKLWGWGRGTDG